MKLKELIDKLQAIYERDRHRDELEVVVRLYDTPSIAYAPATSVTQIGGGIDWDRYTVFIYTEDKVKKV